MKKNKKPGYNPEMLNKTRADKLFCLLKELLPNLKTSNKDLDLLNRALTHISFDSAQNYEELEFLGDAVLRLACSEFLDRQKPRLSVGERSRIRAYLVSDQWLTKLAKEIQLGALIKQSNGSSNDLAAQATIQADCCEALIAAIYLCYGGADGGLTAVHQWLDPHWQSSWQELADDPERHNWKSALQELTQAQKVGIPIYNTTEVSTSHGDPQRFRSVVSVNDRKIGDGLGPSRRLAEQQAASAALKTLRPSSES